MNPIESVYQNKIIAVIRAEDASEAFEKAFVMYQCGIKVFEITTEKEGLVSAITEMKKNTDAVVFAGGVITSSQAQAAINAGADTIVSPVFQLSLLKYCTSSKIPHIATVSTANEAYNAWKTRLPLIKLFPAKSMGQVEYLEDLLRPMPFLRLMPSGGVTIEDYTKYLHAGAVAVGIGRSLYKDASISEIKERAKFAVEQLKKVY